MKINRAVYRLWHEGSERGRVGYIGKDKYYPHRTYLKCRAKDSHCPLLYKALQKYDIDSWKVDVLQSDLQSDSELSEAEILWIAKFNSKVRGYNCTDGGEGGNNPNEETRKKIGAAHRGKVVSEETRAKQSTASTGRRHSEEAKTKISLSSEGEKHWNYGQTRSLETRRKISASLKGKKYPPRSPEHCQALSKSLQGNTNKLGWRCPEEVKKKIGDAQRGEKNHAYGKRTVVNAGNATINITIPESACSNVSASSIRTAAA